MAIKRDVCCLVAIVVFFRIYRGLQRPEAPDLKLFSIIDTITVSPVVGTPERLIRWGHNGLAFNTDGGQIVLIGGNFVK
jgi:hypothetical protein